MTEEFFETIGRIDAMESKIRMNKSARKALGAIKYNAACDFLESIHIEIFNVKPAFEREAIEADLRLLANGDQPESAQIAPERPELTEAYLHSIGYNP